VSTSAQIIANQANAQLSTGPRTEAGKAESCLNNFRHGFTGAFHLLAWEDEEAFETLWLGLRAEHHPATVTETVLVEKMAQALWLSKRAQTLQHFTFNAGLPSCDNEKQLALYLRYETTHERAFHKCLTQLLKLRAEKRKAEIGFESQEQKQAQQSRRAADENRKQAAETRKQELHRFAVLLAQAKLDHEMLQNHALHTAQIPGSATNDHRIETTQAA